VAINWEQIHIFGHIHEGYGVTVDEQTIYVNGSNCTFHYKPTNKPIVIDIIKE
jgi:Icc-related predicted phosphoesterase